MVKKFLLLNVHSRNNRSICNSYFKNGKKQICTQQMLRILWGYFLKYVVFQKR